MKVYQIQEHIFADKNKYTNIVAIYLNKNEAELKLQELIEGLDSFKKLINCPLLRFNDSYTFYNEILQVTSCEKCSKYPYCYGRTSLGIVEIEVTE